MSEQSQHQSIDVLGLGVAAIDDLLYVEEYPKADSKVRVQRRERQCGGLTATALVAAARLGSRCAYAGVLGNDALAEYVIERLQSAGVDTSHVVRRDGAGPVYSTIVVDMKRHTRNIFCDMKDVVGADDHLPADGVIRSARVLFVDHIGMPGQLRAARIAHAAGIPIVSDIERDTAPEFAELFGLVDHAILSQAFAEKLTRCGDPAAAALKLAQDGKRTAVVTAGAMGAWYAAAGSAKAEHVPAFNVQVVDTTGCGDVFHGAYASALARGLPLAQRVRIASAAAALKATVPGGQAGIPTIKEVEALMG